MQVTDMTWTGSAVLRYVVPSRITSKDRERDEEYCKLTDHVEGVGGGDGRRWGREEVERGKRERSKKIRNERERERSSKGREVEGKNKDGQPFTHQE